MAGLVLLAGSTRPLGDVIVEQLTTLANLDGKVDAAEAAQIEKAKAFQKAAAAPDLQRDAILDVLGARLPGSYLLDLRAYDAPKVAASLTVPILVLQGGRDYQVTRADLDGWRATLGTRKNATLRVFDNLNHLFVAGTGPSSPAEYQQPGHVDARVVQAIAEWVGGSVK